MLAGETGVVNLCVASPHLPSAAQRLDRFVSPCSQFAARLRHRFAVNPHQCAVRQKDGAVRDEFAASDRLAAAID